MKFQDRLVQIEGSSTDRSYMGLCTVKDFLTLTKTPVVQRNHEDRVNKDQVSYFEDILPQHRVVSVGIYEGKEFEYEGGEVISPGDALVVDGNTRKCFWQRAVEAGHPMIVELFNRPLVVCVKLLDDPLEIEHWYETFDSNGQIKKPAHAMQSAAHIAGMQEDHIVKLSTMLTKVVKGVEKTENDTAVSLRVKKIAAFGKHHIEDFYKLLDGKITKEIKSKASPFIAAYRALRVSSPISRYPDIDKFFLDTLQGGFDTPPEDGGMYIPTYLFNTVMTRGTYSYLNPNASSRRIEIVGGVLYRYGKRYLTQTKYVNPRRLVIPNSPEGAKRAADIFSTDVVI